MPTEHVETLIIGAGQSGLAMSHMLKRRGRPHLVLERARIAERWRTERWDGLRFQFPNWSVRLPDFAFPHTDPDGFATSGEIVEYLSAYANFVGAPVRCGVEVTALRPHNVAGFLFLIRNATTGYPSVIDGKPYDPGSAAQKTRARAMASQIIARYGLNVPNPY